MVLKVSTKSERSRKKYWINRYKVMINISKADLNQSKINSNKMLRYKELIKDQIRIINDSTV